MSAAAAIDVVIDSLAFATGGQELKGRVPLADMLRLRDTLSDTGGEVSYVVRGGKDALDRPMLSLEVEALLHLQCQRCLERLDFPLRFSSHLLLVPEGGTEPEDVEDPEGPDWIEGSPELGVNALVEDEMLLAVPLAPRHPEGMCVAREPGMADREGGTSGSKGNAFAALAALKDKSS